MTYTARPGGPGVLLFRGRKRVGSFTAPLRISRRGRPVQLLGKADTGVADGSYRGSLVLHRARGGLAVVNELPLDEYVQGVVPSEMPAELAPRGAEVAGGGRPLLRRVLAAAVGDLRPPSRHAFAGLHRRVGRAGRVHRGGAGHPPPGAHLRGRADHRVLLLHLRRADRERGELVRGLRAAALPGQRARPLRPHLAPPPLRAALQRARDGPPPAGAVRGPLPARGGDQARGVSANRPRADRGHEGRHADRGRAAAHAARPARHLGALLQGGHMDRPRPAAGRLSGAAPLGAVRGRAQGARAVAPRPPREASR